MTAELLDEIIGAQPDDVRLAIADIMPRLAARVEQQAEAQKARELEKTVNELRDYTDKRLSATIEEIRKNATPPGPADIQMLLDQEYLSFKLTLPVNGNNTSFTLTELPVSNEKMVLASVKSIVGDLMTEIGKWEWTADQPMIRRVERLLTVIPGALDIACAAVLVCLRLDGKEQPGWVADNLSTFRIVSILHAQVQVNRYRDFLSLVSRTSNALM